MKHLLPLLLILASCANLVDTPPETPPPTHRTVCFSWDANPIEENVQGYRLYLSPTADLDLETVYDFITEPEHCIENMEVGLTWWVVVSAYNEKGEGPLSDSLKFSVTWPEITEYRYYDFTGFNFMENTTVVDPVVRYSFHAPRFSYDYGAITVERSIDLVTWTKVTGKPEILPLGDEELVSFNFDLVEPREFYRLKAVSNPMPVQTVVAP